MPEPGPSPAADAAEQPLQFHDRRTALAFVAGILALALIGVMGGALIRDACEELFTVGERRSFVRGDPARVITDDPAAAEALRGYGETAGLGGWRGSVGLDPGARVVATADGFLVFTGVGIDALEPGLSAVNASRGSVDRRALEAFNGAAVGATGDAPWEVAVLDEDLALIGCGEVARPEPVIAIDRARALHAEGSTLRAVGLDGEEDWSHTFDAPVTRADLLLGAVLVTTEERVRLMDLGDGAVRRRWSLRGARPLAVDQRWAVVTTATGRTVRLDLAEGGSTELEVDPSAGVAIVAGTVMTGAALPPLPGDLPVLDLHATRGAYVAVETTVDDDRRLLLYGPVSAAG